MMDMRDRHEANSSGEGGDPPMARKTARKTQGSPKMTVCVAFCVIVGGLIPNGCDPGLLGYPFPSVCPSPIWPMCHMTAAKEAEFLASLEAEWDAGLIERQQGLWRTHHLGGGRLIAVSYLTLFGNLLCLSVAIVVAKRAEAALRPRWDRRYRPGHCRSCGYDLRGNTSGTCPECGTPTGTEANT